MTDTRTTSPTSPTSPSTGTAPARGLPGRAALLLVASFALGIATSWAQGALPDQLTSLANSAGGWTLVTFGLVAWSGARPVLAAVLGTSSFLLLNVGYAVLSAVHGLSYALTPGSFWVAVGFLAGPLVGLGASWVRHRRDVLAGVGVAGLAGLLFGEAVHGLTAVAASTSPVYWVVSAVLGVALLAWAVPRRLDGARARATAVVVAVLVAAGYPLVLAALAG